MLKSCTLCGHRCQVNRRSGQKGRCRSTDEILISSYGPHFGEEGPVSGWAGSGTIFLSGCNLDCVFCQNAEISQLGQGITVSPERLAEIMVSLQNMGCHNINLVSPTHYVPGLLNAIYLAAEAGLTLPIVYNSGGYDSLETIDLLDGIVDIYMPDMKYGDATVGFQYSRCVDYPAVNLAAVKRMFDQVGDLKISEQGIAEQGLLIRHLVLPNGMAGTGEVLRFVAQNLSTNTYINLMDQYYPAYKAHQYPDINRKLTNREFQEAITLAEEHGLKRIDGFV